MFKKNFNSLKHWTLIPVFMLKRTSLVIMDPKWHSIMQLWKHHQFVIVTKVPVVLCFQSPAHQSTWLSWSRHWRETVRWHGTRCLMLTATRPSSNEGTVLTRRAATPPATTVPTGASVATRMWCLCLRSTRPAAVPKEKFSTIPPVRSSRFWRFFYILCHNETFFPLAFTRLLPVVFSALLSRGCIHLRGKHRHSRDHMGGLAGGRTVRDSGCRQFRSHPV